MKKNSTPYILAMSSVAQLEARIFNIFSCERGVCWTPCYSRTNWNISDKLLWHTWPQFIIILWKFRVYISNSFLFITTNVGILLFSWCLLGVCSVFVRCLREKISHTWSVCKININTNGGYQVSCWKWMM